MTDVLHQPRLTMPIDDRDHIRGPATAPVALLEYGDYECPYCRAAHGELQELFAMMGDEIRYAWRHFPLTQIHTHAEQAAEAAEAAGQHGRFWDMHDMLFANQRHLELRDLLDYARALDLDANRVAFELQTHMHAPRVREDFVSGVRSGVNGTPTFFFNGIRHNGGWDVASLAVAVREAI